MKQHKNSLKTISKADFIKKLKTRELENIEVINDIEKYFLKKRGYVFKMPKPGESVILLYSGGLDSTVAWAYLIEKYKLQVYPLVVLRSKSLGQLRSIRFFSKYFKKKYKKYYHKPFFIQNDLVSKKIKNQLTNIKKMNPQSILDRISINFEPINLLRGITGLFPIYGLTYMQYLKSKHNIDTNTIFVGVLAGDGTVVPTQTFTYLRKIMFCLDDHLPFTDLQISSIFFEKELGRFCEKRDVIKYVQKNVGLPLEKTYGCDRGKLFHCNSCLSCYERSSEFKKAKIVDKTMYYDKLFVIQKADKIYQYLKYHLYKLRKKG